jgi:dCMP deaminase
MTEVVVAYVPVLHDGYRRFVDAHGRDRPLFLIGPELYADYRPLAKDIRALDAELAAQAIAAWGICSQVQVLDVAGAERLAAQAPSLVLPAEDVSYQVVDRFFGRCAVRYDTVFLRWDKSRSVRLLEPRPAARTGEAQAAAQLGVPGDLAALAGAAEAEAARSVDWWRQVGAAMRLAGGELLAAHNVHEPHPLSAYAAGDPRSNFFKGVHLELTTATHAEARLIGEAARRGAATEGAILYVTDFPCPPCAKLIAAAGVATLYYRTGYAVLDGMDVLADAGVEIVQVAQAADEAGPAQPSR